MSKKTRQSFRVPSMDSRCLRAKEQADKYHESGTVAYATVYAAWHRGYDAAIRDIRKALKVKP